MAGERAEPGRMRMMMMATIAVPPMLAGCVNVTAPDKPIVIDLNINVSQEVVYRLDAQAKTVIQQNPGVF